MRRKIISILVVLTILLSYWTQMPVSIKAASDLRYSLKGYSLYDDDMSDAEIYAKSSITKHIGDSSFYVDDGYLSDGDIYYWSSNNKVATVNKKGLIKIKGCGTATITIFIEETDLYYSKEKDVKVTILPGNVKDFKVKSAVGGVKCNWRKLNYDNIKCIIQASEDKKFRNYVIAKPYPRLKRGYWKGTGLKSNKTYYIRIRQIAKISDNRFKYGKWSKIVKVKIK